MASSISNSFSYTTRAENISGYINTRGIAGIITISQAQNGATGSQGTNGETGPTGATYTYTPATGDFK